MSHKPTLATIKATPPINDSDSIHQDALVHAVEAALAVPYVFTEDASPQADYARGWDAAVDAVRQGLGCYLDVPGVPETATPTAAELARDAPVGTVLRVVWPGGGRVLVYERLDEVWWSCQGQDVPVARLFGQWSLPENASLEVTVIFDPERGR